MERPHVEVQPKQREVTGEIVYLDEMRRLGQDPKPYLELADMAIQNYEIEADMCKTHGVRPDIMDEYDHYDSQISEAEASCLALADELLALKEPDNSLTFVNIEVDDAPEEVLAKLKTTAAGNLLASDDEQLAMESDGGYYPVLDMRKQNARLAGVGVRIWGWNDAKYLFTNKEGQPYKYPRDCLMYPSGETAVTRQLELSFGYVAEGQGSFTESVSLYLSEYGSAHISSQIWAAAYAETGYEGHHGKGLHELTDDDIAAFGDLIAEVVGDSPESVGMRNNRKLQRLTEAAATPAASQAVQDLIEATWPAQASYILSSKPKGADKNLAQQLLAEDTADTAVATINEVIQKWQEARQ